jgi:transcriptional regulator with XRE-family HTH domain
MLGTILREARKSLGFSQKKLAELSGVSLRYISAIEKGGPNPSVRITHALATALQVPELAMEGLTLVTAESGAVLPFPLLERTLHTLERESAEFAARLALSRRMFAAFRSQPRTRPDGSIAPDLIHIELPLPPRFTWRARPGIVGESRDEWTGVPLAGEVTFGEPLHPPADDTHILIPATAIDPGELLYRVIGSTLGEWNIDHGDLLVVEPRPDGRAANGEFVLAQIGERVVVGRWWTKGGTRQVLSVRAIHGHDDAEPVVIGAITTILRDYDL